MRQSWPTAEILPTYSTVRFADLVHIGPENVARMLTTRMLSDRVAQHIPDRVTNRGSENAGPDPISYSAVLIIL